MSCPRYPGIPSLLNLVRPLSPGDFPNPPILLAVAVDYSMYAFFRDRLAAAPREGIVVVELSTLGGDPEVARMMGEDIRYHSEHEPNRRFVFLGKAAIYSAGATFMSFFARPNCYLTHGTSLVIHERKLQTNILLDGPLTACIASLKAQLDEIKHSIQIQNEGFANLIAGSSVTMDEEAGARELVHRGYRGQEPRAHRGRDIAVLDD
jgi:hypothetical protein